MLKKIVLIHGWGSNQKKWERVKNILQKNGFEVLIFDLPGFGEAPPPREVWGIKNYSDFVLKKIEEKGWENLYLLGHSFGGQIATFLALHYQNKMIKKMILCAPAIIRKQGLKYKIFAKVARLGRKFLEIFGLKKMIPQFQKIISKFWGWDYYKTQGIMKKIIKKVFKEDLTPLLDKIKIPTLLIWGNKDKMVPLKYGALIKKKIPNSKLVILENIGHSPHIECPKKISKEIINFSR